MVGSTAAAHSLTVEYIREGRLMNTRTVALLVATSIASATLAVAQTSPQPDTTSPNAASSPHQRDTTSSTTQAPEAPTGNGANPAAASTPHQQQATSQMGTAGHKQAMKDCITKQQADHSGMSKADAKKACKEQSKANAK
jgi:hypothetical protein